MAKRQQHSIISGLAILSLGLLLLTTHFTSDIHSPGLFVFKAGLQIISSVFVIGLLVFATCARDKLISIATLLVCLVNIPFLLPKLGDSSFRAQKSRDAILKVATFSTLTRTNTVNDIADFILAEDPQLLCLQELTQEHRLLLLNKLNGHYAHYIENGNNQLTLSHHPLHLAVDQSHFLVSELSHPELGNIEVINAHMPRPYQTPGIVGSWEKLLKRLNNKNQAIVCGDLNITPNNSLYEVLRFNYDLNDSLTSGYGFTYPNAQRRTAVFGPLIRIDYVLSRGMIAHSTRTINISNLSDHRAVITHLTPSRAEQ